MKKSRIVAALLCASVSLSTAAAFAQGRPGGPGDEHHEAHGPDNGHHANGPADNRHDNGHASGHENVRPPMHAQGGPDGPGHGEWHKGDRLAHDYRDRQYVVDDWRGYGLHQPPRGYQWVGVGGDYLLVAVASGIIAQIVASQ
ncbi:Probable transmembrane protein [Caballeronia glathei]|uniref:Membrane protein n=1 Tax=Caballeronia glathei TaxID=60547 RepID=A0A069PJW6_9BURK|nr:RcnB family protein [Caballeronia glathei]KDR40209.1 membrane protein [Caballeronia glathei]CDY79783.1 Probable transmembrane protein [Caballeronia glathei]